MSSDHKVFHGHKKSDFQDLVMPFRFWTFINVQNRFKKLVLGIQKNDVLYILTNFLLKDNFWEKWSKSTFEKSGAK